jgi:PKD repeat protein
LVLVCLIVAPAAWAESTLASTGTGYAKVSRACPPPKPGSATCFALVRVPVSSTAAGEVGVRPYAVNDGASKSGPAGGLTPAQLASAYGYEPTAGGSGQTVAIVDAYDDPNIESDLAKFDTEYGIAACTTANNCFEKVGQTGEASSLPAPDESGWSVEISLDVEAVHSVCQTCKILLVEADNSEFTNLAAAVNEAVSLGATEVSNSYGGPEARFSGVEEAFNHRGVVIAAATGDDGYDDWTYLNDGYVPPAKPNIPASLPSVVAVGGTTLKLSESGKRASEKVWNGNGPLDERYFEGFSEGATGGGCSTIFTAQPWQQDVSAFAATGCGNRRLAADVSAVADPLTGFDIYDSYNCGEACEEFKRGKDWLTIGGTSLSTPLISGLYALAGGSDGVSYPSLTLYGHLGDASSLYDVTDGGNGFCDAAPESECGHPDAFGALVNGYALDVDCEYTTSCNAAPGFDGPSGVGTPNSLSLFKPLLPTAAITPPGSPEAGLAASFSAETSSDPYPGAILSYSWGWGDGTPDSSGVLPSHAYSEPGKYTVTLTVSDSYGFESAPATALINVTGKTAKERKEEQEAKERQAAEEAKEAREAREAKETREAKEKEEAADKSSTSPGGQMVLGFQSTLTPPVPDAELANTSLQASATGIVSVKISCPAGVGSCAGTVTLRTLDAVSASMAGSARSKSSILTLATGSFSVVAGKVAAVVIHLSGEARALLGRSHTLHVRATIIARSPTGATHTGSVVVTLRVAKPKHGKG